MDSFVCSPFSTYQSFRSSPALGRGWDPAAKQPSWKQSKSGGISPFLGGPFTPLPSEYLDSYRRVRWDGAGGEPSSRAARNHPMSSMVVPVLPRVDSGSPGAEEPLACKNPHTLSLQFLEQKYGYFHCKDCKTRWESAYVWCISGSNKVYFKQLCRKCQKGFNPYRVEAIQCQICSKTRCSCPQKKRHIDLKRPHRQELCGRCRGKRLSCDSTYSFKYIV
ncbi:PREDICTED: ZAR1-like protein [Corvus brachyrhynchos]|uniref:ZAR1-like protein n=1 Tax=Corvus brachyrhynchos TaxID=85066 RepID=UPI000816643C|nr:PREDICTED: ZAR1-like protein [Corvus brachyrhynchos]